MKILDNYRYELVSNRRAIDIYKDSIVNIDFNIDFNSREGDNNSSNNIKIDNISINKSDRCPDGISINSIVSNYKEANANINDSVSIRARAITKNGIYNYERGDCIISTNKQKEKIRTKV